MYLKVFIFASGRKKSISINPSPELRSFCPCRFRHLGWPEVVINCPGIYVVVSCHSSSSSDYPIFGHSTCLSCQAPRKWCTRYQRSCSFHRFATTKMATTSSFNVMNGNKKQLDKSSCAITMFQIMCLDAICKKMLSKNARNIMIFE